MTEASSELQPIPGSGRICRVLGMPWHGTDFFAHDISENWYEPSRALLHDAVEGYARHRMNLQLQPGMDLSERREIVEPLSRRATEALKRKFPLEALQAGIPGATWYYIERNGDEVQMIVAGQVAWVAKCHVGRPVDPTYTAKTLSLADAYALVRTI